MQAYLKETREMVRQGRHEQALERFLWFHDHALEHAPSMCGVRLSFALGYWKELGDVYPPARAALEATRDRKERMVMDNKGGLELFADVVGLNRALGEDSRSISLFEMIDRKRPGVARRYWRVARDAVITAKRYDLARKFVKNAAREFGRVKEMFDHNTTLVDDPRIGGARFRALNESHLVKESLKLIALALAFEDLKGAKTIQRRALALVDDDCLRNAIPSGAPRGADGGREEEAGEDKAVTR